MEADMIGTLFAKSRREWLSKIFFSVILYTITFTIVFRHTGILNSDYGRHMQWAKELRRGNIYAFFQFYPSFMWHLLVKIFYKIFAMPIEYAAAAASALTNVAVYLITAEILKKYEVDKSAVISFCLMLIGPLYAPWFSANYYLGQYAPNIWHNPTNLMVKPFAVYCFFLILKILEDIQNDKRIEKRQWVILSVLVFLSVVAKPSFAQGIIPGLGIYLIFCCFKNRFRNIMKYICLCLTFVPCVLLMLYNIWLNWGSEGGRGSIKIGWFTVISHYTPNEGISLLLSFAFPLLYIIFNWNRTLKRADVQLSLCYFAMSWLEYALLYETVGTYAGNFSWARLIAAFIFWMVIMMSFCRDIQHFSLDDKLLTIKNTVLTVVLSIHLLCGCWYAYKQIIGPIWY